MHFWHVTYNRQELWNNGVVAPLVSILLRRNYWELCTSNFPHCNSPLAVASWTGQARVWLLLLYVILILLTKGLFELCTILKPILQTAINPLFSSIALTFSPLFKATHSVYSTAVTCNPACGLFNSSSVNRFHSSTLTRECMVWCRTRLCVHWGPFFLWIGSLAYKCSCEKQHVWQHFWMW